jgi:hypothetical protein
LADSELDFSDSDGKRNVLVQDGCSFPHSDQNELKDGISQINGHSIEGNECLDEREAVENLIKEQMSEGGEKDLQSGTLISQDMVFRLDKDKMSHLNSRRVNECQVEFAPKAAIQEARRYAMQIRIFLREHNLLHPLRSKTTLKSVPSTINSLVA